MATETSDDRKLNQPLFLDWRKLDGEVVVTPRDQDRFVVKQCRIIEMLQQARQQEAFTAQFKLLLTLLAKWIQIHPAIQSSHVTVADGALLFVVVKTTPQYDAKFEDELSQLDLDIAEDEDLDLIKIHSIGLPPASPEALSTFLDPSFTFTYAHGN